MWNETQEIPVGRDPLDAPHDDPPTGGDFDPVLRAKG
jgi:hypothetical protein